MSDAFIANIFNEEVQRFKSSESKIPNIDSIVEEEKSKMPLQQIVGGIVSPPPTVYINTIANEYGQRQEGGYSVPQPYDVGADIEKVGKIAKGAIQKIPPTLGKTVGGVVQSIEEQPHIQTLMALGRMYTGSDTKLEYGKTAATYWDKKIQEIDSQVEIAPDSPMRYVKGAMDSLALNVPFILAGALTGNHSLALTGLATVSGASEYADLRRKGIDPSTAGKAALGYFVMEGVGEKVSLGNLLSSAPLVKKVFQQAVLEPVGEMVTELGQFLVDKKVLPEETKWSDLYRRLVDTAVVSLLASGGQTVVIHPVVKLVSMGQKATPEQIAQLGNDIADNINQEQDLKLEEEANIKKQQFLDNAEKIAEEESGGNPDAKVEIFNELQDDYVEEQDKVINNELEDERKNRFLKATGQEVEGEVEKVETEEVSPKQQEFEKRALAIAEREAQGDPKVREELFNEMKDDYAKEQQKEVNKKRKDRFLEASGQEVKEIVPEKEQVDEQQAEAQIEKIMDEEGASQKIDSLIEEETVKVQKQEIVGKKTKATELKQQIKDKFTNLSDEQVDTGMALIEARAESEGITVDEYVGTRFKGIKAGSELKGDALKQESEWEDKLKKEIPERGKGKYYSSSINDNKNNTYTVTLTVPGYFVVNTRRRTNSFATRKQVIDYIKKGKVPEYNAPKPDYTKEIPIESGRFKGRRQRWDLEHDMRSGIADKDIIAYHYSDSPIKKFIGTIPLYTEYSKSFNKYGYYFKIRKGTPLTLIGSPVDEIRVNTSSLKDKVYSLELENGFPPEASAKTETLKQDKKAAIQFEQDGRAVIFAFKQADISSLVHEIGHVFRRDLNGEDLQVIKDWTNTKGDKWTVRAEEKFARAFEKYLRDGKAPTSKLKQIFENLKTWLTNIYKRLKGSPLNIKISPEVKQVFDNLLTPKKEVTPKADTTVKKPTTKVVEDKGVLSFPKTAIEAGEVAQETQEILARNFDTTYSIKHNEDLFNASEEKNTPVEDVIANMKNNANPSAEEYVDALRAMSQLRSEGRHKEASQLIFNIAETSKSYGQRIQALSMINKLSPEGALIFAQRLLFQEGVDRQLTPSEAIKIVKSATEASKASKNKLLSNDLDEGVISDIFNKSKKGMVKNLIGSLKKRKMTSKERQFVNSITSTLKEQMKEILPEKVKAEKITSLDKLVEGIENPDKFIEIWNKAAEKMKKDHPNEAYFLDSITPKGYTDTIVTKATNELVKQFTDNLYTNILKGNDLDLVNNIIKSLTSMDGISESTGRSLAKVISKEFFRLTNKVKDTGLRNIAKKNNIKLKDLKNMYLLGLTESKNFNKFAEKLGFGELDDVTRVKFEAAFGKGSVSDTVRIVKAAELMDVIAHLPELKKANIGKKLGLIQTFAMLLNASTLMRNIVGNTGLMVANMAITPGLIATDKVVSIVTGKRTIRTNLALKERAKGFTQPIRDFTEGYSYGRGQKKTIWQSIKEGLNILVTISRLNTKGKYDSGDMKAINLYTFDNILGRTSENVLTALLGIPDRAAWQSSFEAEMKNQLDVDAKSKEETNVDIMIENSRLKANKDTFQDDNFMSENLAKGKKLLNKISSFNQSPDFGVGDAVMKFTKVPSSIGLQSIEWSPLGMIRVGYSTLTPMFSFLSKRGWTPKSLAEHSALSQRQFVEAVVKSTAAGTVGLFGMGMYLASRGVISAEKDEDRKVQAIKDWMEILPMSINWDKMKRLFISGDFFSTKEIASIDGDRQVSFDWALPLSVPVVMGAVFFNEHKKQKKAWLTSNPKDYYDMLLLLTNTGFNVILKQPVMTGLERFMKDFTFNKRMNMKKLVTAYIKQYGNLAIGFTPSIWNAYTKWTDNIKRETRSTDMAENIINKIIARTSFAKKVLPAKIGIFGEVVHRFQGESNTWYNSFMNPAYQKTLKSNPLGKELLSIYEKTAETSHIPKEVDKKVSINLTGETGKSELKALTVQELTDYQTVIGKVTVNAFNSYMQHEPYWQLSAEQKSKLLATTMTDISCIAKMKLFGHVSKMGKAGTFSRLLFNNQMEAYINKRLNAIRRSR